MVLTDLVLVAALLAIAIGYARKGRSELTRAAIVYGAVLATISRARAPYNVPGPYAGPPPQRLRSRRMLPCGPARSGMHEDGVVEHDAGRRPGRLALATVVACAVALVVMGVRVHGMGAPLGIDREVDRRVPALSGGFAMSVMSFGGGAAFLVLLALLVGGSLALRDRYAALVCAVAAPGAVGLTEWVGKPLVARAEPAGLGYPSGHVTGAAVIAVLIVLIGFRRWSWWGLAVLGPLAVAITAVMAASVIRLHFHYFTDTVAGVLVACGTVAATTMLVSLGAGRLVVRAQSDRAST